MTKLQICTNKSTGFSAYINQETGDAFLTASLIAKILEIDTKQISRIIAQSKTVTNHASKYTETLTTTGEKTVTFLVASTDFKHVLKAAKKLPSSNKELIESIQDKLIDAGTTAFVYNLCGYSMQQPVAQTALPQTYADALRALASEVEEKEKAQLALTAAQPLISYAEAADQNHAGTSLGAFGVIYSQKVGIVPPLGRRKAFALARELGVIQKAPSNIPYQTFINRGYFLVGQNRDGWTYCRLTKSGMIWLLRAAERNQFQQHDPTEVWVKPMHQRGLNVIEREQKAFQFIAGGGKPTQSNIAKFLDITTDALKKYVRRNYESWNQFLDLVNPEEVR